MQNCDDLLTNLVIHLSTMVQILLANLMISYLCKRRGATCVLVSEKYTFDLSEDVPSLW